MSKQQNELFAWFALSFLVIIGIVCLSANAANEPQHQYYIQFVYSRDEVRNMGANGFEYKGMDGSTYIMQKQIK